jgi:hypothetical protein
MRENSKPNHHPPNSSADSAAKAADLEHTPDFATTLRQHSEWLHGRSGGARADLSDADLRDADLRDADLRGADLRGADLSDADLRGAVLSDADLRGADLSDADLRDADLRDADLSDAYLRDADLSGADLRGADLRDAHLRGADLRGADLSGTGCLTLRAGAYWCWMTPERCRVGCREHEHAWWGRLTPERGRHLAGDAEEWIRHWLPVVLAACRACAAHGWPEREECI